jgi:hypothetical protein
VHRGAQIDVPDLEAALAGVGQHLAAQLGGALGRLLDLLEARVDLARHGGAPGQVGVAEDAGQQVVEVVRDAAGEQAQALELLRLAQLLFHRRLLGLVAAALGDVAIEGQQVAVAADPEGMRVHLDVDHFAVVAGVGHLDADAIVLGRGLERLLALALPGALVGEGGRRRAGATPCGRRPRVGLASTCRRAAARLRA